MLLDKLNLQADDCRPIASAIEKETVIAVCDGPFNPNDCLGTAAFLMVVNKKDNDALTGSNWSLGTTEDQTAYRSELTGFDCILAVLAISMKHYDIKKEQLL